MSGQSPGARDAIRVFDDQAVALEAVKQRPGLGVVADTETATDVPATGAGVLGEVAERPGRQQRGQPADGRAAIIEVMTTRELPANSQLTR